MKEFNVSLNFPDVTAQKYPSDLENYPLWKDCAMGLEVDVVQNSSCENLPRRLPDLCDLLVCL